MLEVYRRVGGTCWPHIHFILVTGRTGSCETLPPQYTALYPYIPGRLYLLRVSLSLSLALALATWMSVCYVTVNSLLKWVQDSIKSHTMRVRGDVTSRGLAALHSRTHIGPSLSRDTWCDIEALACNRYTYSMVQAILPDIMQQNVEPNQIKWIIKTSASMWRGFNWIRTEASGRIFTNMAMNLRVPFKLENVLTNWMVDSIFFLLRNQHQYTDFERLMHQHKVCYV